MRKSWWLAVAAGGAGFSSFAACAPVHSRLYPTDTPEQRNALLAAAAKFNAPSTPASVTAQKSNSLALAAVAPAAARLIPATCESEHEAVEQELAQMRAEIAAEYKRWHAAQPECWAQDRERERERIEDEICRLQPARCGQSGLGRRGSGFGSGGAALGGSMGFGSAGMFGHGSGGGTAQATSFSRTNNQVARVDEADIVKTDGRYVYMLANGALRIATALDPRMLSATRVAGFPREMLVEGDHAVVFTANAQGRERCTYGYDCEVGGDGTTTTAHVFDIQDRNAPKLVRTLQFTGSLMASRRIGSTVHVVVADGDTASRAYSTWPEEMDTCGTAEPVVRSKFAALRKLNEAKIRAAFTLPSVVDHGVAQPLCAGLLNNAFDQVHTFTSIVSFDMQDASSALSSASVRSRPGTVFASENALYFATQRSRDHRPTRGLTARGQLRAWYPGLQQISEVSEIHKLHIGARPNDTRYAGSGLVPGHVLNQFAMDEWGGNLRIATTIGKVPDPKVESTVTILGEDADGNLARRGAVEHLAPGEDLRAIRFDDDRSYLVTFKKTDPLFVLDMHDAARPAVLGELKIPGFSTYLHRLDKTHLLSVGYDANDHGEFAYFDGVLLQLFDVGDEAAPKLLHREKIGTRGSSSESLGNHLAFNYFADKGLLALPVGICEGGSDGHSGDQLSFAGLAVYRVGLEKGFERLGGIEHSKAGSSCSRWWSNPGSSVKRSIFVDDLVYSIASDRAKVQRLSALGTDVADLPF